MKRVSRLASAIFLIFVFFVAISRVSSVYAQDASWIWGDYPDSRESAENGRVSSPVYSGHVQSSIQAFTVEQLTGAVEGVTVPVGTYKRNPQYAQKMNRGSAVGVLNQYIAAMYTAPPADLALWIRDTGQTLGFIPKQANAQGIGFSGLAPLLPIWKAFRNIAYILMAIVMIVIGFMVMLRKKIDPKTVVTVQNSLPKIVITLLLITFSYAIVGLMIDLMYLVMLLAIGIFQTTVPLPQLSTAGQYANIFSPYQSLTDLYTRGGLLANMFHIFGAPILGGGVTNPTDMAYHALGIDPGVGQLTGGLEIVGGILLTILGGPWGSVIGIPLAAFGAAAPLLGLIISLALLFITIKLFIFFLSAYIQILVAVIFAPVQLVFEAFPGSSAFSGWIKNLFANLIVFPIGAVMFMLAAMFANMSTSASGNLWTPPYTPLYSMGFQSIASLVSLAIIFVIPTIAGQIKESLKAKAGMPIGPGAILGPMGSGAGQIFQLGYQGSFIASAFRHKVSPSDPLTRQSDAGKADLLKQMTSGGGSGPHP